MPAKCNRSNNGIGIIYIFPGLLISSSICDNSSSLIYYTNGTFFYKTGLLHAFMSDSLRVPIQIVKYVENGHIFFGSVIFAESAAW